MLKTCDYRPSKEEVAELETAIRLETAKLAKIDGERLQVRIKGATAFIEDTEESYSYYWRAESCDLDIDVGYKVKVGAPPLRVLILCCRQAVLEVKRPIIESHLSKT